MFFQKWADYSYDTIMRRLTSFFILILLLNFHCGLAVAKETTKENFYSLPQLKKIQIQKDVMYQTEGYVIMQYHCPPCPENAVCQPCPTPFIVISLKSKLIEYPDQMGPDDLNVFIRQDDLKLGKKYHFTLQFSNMISFGQDGPNLEAVEAILLQKGSR